MIFLVLLPIPIVLVAAWFLGCWHANGIEEENGYQGMRR